ncbi:hypothetical protein OsJ_14424 [Oryza sativa Japonica Group]|uniref:Uncharacterized protein n=1 Tax=Oryza sativa subsp. japonica TaxID=39947 RepID=B9FEN5_ORYSJ|nr:hypothetical protein OsJ_14424 [Oryza sativa Japonica Group]
MAASATSHHREDLRWGRDKWVIYVRPDVVIGLTCDANKHAFKRSTVLDNTPTSEHSLDDRRPLIGVRKSNVRSTIKGKEVLHVRTLELLA